MMLRLLLVSLATVAGGWVFPWWWPALVAGLSEFLLAGKGAGASARERAATARGAFASGFLGAAFAWAGLAGFIDWRNHGLLSGRIAEVFHLPHPLLMISLSALLGGLAGGLGGWLGNSLRPLIFPYRPRA